MAISNNPHAQSVTFASASLGAFNEIMTNHNLGYSSSNNDGTVVAVWSSNNPDCSAKAVLGELLRALDSPGIYSR
jgi:hypothetical protein